jgi:3D-(3,5/4)-trihydroxycyclohexane-1,2-dione acylhydrolase (decyclizing)
VTAIRAARRPLIVAGGGVRYSAATEALAAFAAATGIPVAETQAGKGSLRHDHPASVGAIGATGTTAANALAAEADLVLGIGTRFADFTTASHTAFADPDVRFVNINVCAADAVRLAGLAVLADARRALEQLTTALAGWRVPDGYRRRAADLAATWSSTVDGAYRLGHAPLPAQSEVIGAVNEAATDADVVVCAAGSMPGDLHKLWRAGAPRQYHVEYGYSCMGYEIAGGLGAKLAIGTEGEVFVLVGDGSYLMMAQELVTAVAEGVKLIVVLVDNAGFASIGALSETVGAPRFGTWYRYRDEGGGLTGDVLPTDLAANAASLGAAVTEVSTVEELRSALAAARRSPRTTVIRIGTDPLVPAPDSAAWWDVPVAEAATLPATVTARREYEQAKQTQRHYL